MNKQSEYAEKQADRIETIVDRMSESNIRLQESQVRLNEKMTELTVAVGKVNDSIGKVGIENAQAHTDINRSVCDMKESSTYNFRIIMGLIAVVTIVVGAVVKLSGKI